LNHVITLSATTRLGDDFGKLGLGSNWNPFGVVAIDYFSDDLAKVVASNGNDFHEIDGNTIKSTVNQNKRPNNSEENADGGFVMTVNLKVNPGSSTEHTENPNSDGIDCVFIHDLSGVIDFYPKSRLNHQSNQHGIW